MTSSDLKHFVEYLLRKNYIVHAPVKRNGRVVIRRILDSKNFTLIKERPLYPFKEYLLPSTQTLFQFAGGKNKAISKGKKIVSDSPKQVLLGITIYDLKAIALFVQVFEKDSYFQNIISQTILIGQSPVPENTTFYDKYEENVLEHIKFDIFLESRFDQNDSRVFTGSKHGQRMLNEFGYEDFEHIEYAGAVPEEGLTQFHKIIRQKVIASRDSKIWKDLGKRCLGCNKCTIVCPTCFCFKIYDTSTILGASASASSDKTGSPHGKSLGLNSNRGEFARYRMWDSCFNSEFSEISGGAKFLKTIQDRIYNWYDHKFVRIPAEYSLPGCVGCGRCFEVCPAGINIKENITKIQKIDWEKLKIKKSVIRKKHRISLSGIKKGKAKS